MRDLDGDGKLDVAVANVAGANVSVLYGNDDGTFPGPSNLAAGFATNALAAADLNGDGRDELLVGWDKTVAVRVNDGKGGFAKINTYGVTGPVVALGAADVDGDQKRDVVATWVGTCCGGKVVDSAILVFPGNGDGTPASADGARQVGSGAR